MMKDKYKTLMIGYLFALLVCVTLRIFGIHFNKLASEYDWFINLCKFLDGYNIIKYILKFIVFNFTTNMFLQAILGVEKYKNKQKIILIVIAILELIRLPFESNLYVTMPIDTFIIVVLPLFYNKKLYKKSILSYIILYIFELASFFIREIDYSDMIYSLQAILSSFEYYFMVLFYKNLCLEIKNKKERRKLWEWVGFYY